MQNFGSMPEGEGIWLSDEMLDQLTQAARNQVLNVSKGLPARRPKGQEPQKQEVKLKRRWFRGLFLLFLSFVADIPLVVAGLVCLITIVGAPVGLGLLGTSGLLMSGAVMYLGKKVPRRR